MIPSHCSRSSVSSPQLVVDRFWSASVVKTTTTHRRMIAKDRATRSRKLKEREYKKSENAVMAIPAVRIWLSVWIPTSKLSVQPLNIRPSQKLLVQRPIPDSAPVPRSVPPGAIDIKTDGLHCPRKE